MICFLNNPRGSSVEAGSSMTRRQEHVLIHPAGNSKQAWRLGCCAAVDGYCQGLPISNK